MRSATVIREWLNRPSKPITRGDLWTLIRISLPLMFFLFFEMVSLFIERIFLSYHSSVGVAASLNATYLATVFQTPCVAFASMSQVFVGLYQGSGELKRIGPCVWQLIWFSLLSLLITLPVSVWVSAFYFKDTAICQAGSSYFNILAVGNFLFPLCTALSSFYFGRGRMLYVTVLMLGSYLLHLFFSWCLIFGVSGLIPSFGIVGGALAKCLSLGIIAIILMRSFLTKKNRGLYHTFQWQFSYKELWSYLRSGSARAFAYFYIKAWWVAIAYLMVRKGGKYLDVLTIGGTVSSFLAFIAVGLYNATLTISSNLLGARNYIEVWRLCRSFLLYIFILGGMLAIPVILFPGCLAYFFDLSAQKTFNEVFPTINYGVWGYVMALTIQMALCALIVSARDLKFQFRCNIFMGFTSFLLFYFIIYQGWWEPDKLWVIMAISSLIFAWIFLMRIRKQNKHLSSIPDQMVKNEPI